MSTIEGRVETFTYRQPPDFRCRIGDYDLHCGDCFQLRTEGKWHQVRIEMADDWWLVGINPSDASHWDGVEVRLNSEEDIPKVEPDLVPLKGKLKKI
jgi:hypothetical protein